MAKVPWWYSVVREWRQRAFLETHRWPPDISMTISDMAAPPTGAIPAGNLTHA